MDDLQRRGGRRSLRRDSDKCRVNGVYGLLAGNVPVAV